MDWIDYVVFLCLSTFFANRLALAVMPLKQRLYCIPMAGLFITLIYAVYAWVRYDFILAIGFGLIVGLTFLVLAPFAIFGVMRWALGEEKYREHIFGNDNSVNK